MDPNSHSMFSGNASSSGLDPMFSGISLQTLLSLNLNPSLFPTLSSLTDDPPPEPIDNKSSSLVVPKNEHPHAHHHLPQLTPHLHQPFNFFPNYHQPSLFHRLPQLRSTDNKRHRLDDTPKTTAFSAPNSVIPQSKLARQRRQKLSEKTRCLQKLMPWDKKMDQATLLEEAYKYVKFLHAQLTVLHSMPCFDSTTTNPSSSFVVSHNGIMHNNNKNNNEGSVYGDLERLNRNQVLQVLVNSPVAQTMLSSQGFCVFSMEQLLLLRKLSERKILLQQMSIMSDHSSNSNKPFFN